MWNNSPRELWNISLRSMWNEIRLFTFAKQIFHSGAISHGGAIFHSPKANFVEKSTHCLGRQMCAFFWWGMVDSDHRSQWQQIYSLPPLAAREIPLILLGSAQAKPWSWWSESNQQPADYKSAALPLSHTSGTRILYHKRLYMSRAFWKFF